jgi:hypothetical protein
VVSKPTKDNPIAPIVYETVAKELEMTKAALEESVKLQSHYARLLNDYDGGWRLTFASAADWMRRLDECHGG